MQDMRRCQGDTTDVDVNDTQDDDDVVEPTDQSDESAVGTEWRRASNKWVVVPRLFWRLGQLWLFLCMYTTDE